VICEPFVWAFPIVGFHRGSYRILSYPTVSFPPQYFPENAEQFRIQSSMRPLMIWAASCFEVCKHLTTAQPPSLSAYSHGWLTKSMCKISKCIKFMRNPSEGQIRKLWRNTISMAAKCAAQGMIQWRTVYIH